MAESSLGMTCAELVGGAHARSGAVRYVRLNVDASFLPTARRRARRVGGGVRFSTVRCLAVKTNADGAQGFGIRFMDSWRREAVVRLCHRVKRAGVYRPILSHSADE